MLIFFQTFYLSTWANELKQSPKVIDKRTSFKIFTALVGDGLMFVMQIDCFRVKVVLLAQVQLVYHLL